MRVLEPVYGPPIPGVTHPTPVVDLTLIPAASPPAGLYVIGHNTCPSCEKGSPALLQKIEVDGETIFIWFCCYSLCLTCDDPHPLLDDGKCDGCAECPENCECTPCRNCQYPSDNLCEQCETCSDCCDCAYCERCERKVGSTVCSCCDGCESCCDCSYCEGCHNSFRPDDFCYECSRCDGCCVCNGSIEAPWQARGITVEVAYQEPPFAMYRAVNPVEAMATFYLLSYMTSTHDVPSPTEERAAFDIFVRQATDRRAELVTKLDRTFQAYVDMAIGGELRHHGSVDELNGYSREMAWGKWTSIREQVGPQALVDAAELFLDFRKSGYGGAPWAAAADLLHMRVTGAIPDWLFVDRVFSMQHNGGSLLDKTIWGDEGRLVTDVNFCTTIGVAHAAAEPCLELLLAASNDRTESLFASWWTARNRVLVTMNRRPEIRPRWRQYISRVGSMPRMLNIPNITSALLKEAA